jgi:hypothetical protein
LFAEEMGGADEEGIHTFYGLKKFRRKVLWRGMDLKEGTDTEGSPSVHISRTTSFLTRKIYTGGKRGKFKEILLKDF